MKLVLQSYDPGNSHPVQSMNHTPSLHEFSSWAGPEQRSLSIPSACMDGKGAQPCRQAICESLGECVQNRRLSAPTGEPDFFEC